MFVLWPNTLLFISAGIVISIVVFVIYGCIKGWENVFPNE